MIERDIYMALVTWTGDIFIKELDFFKSQGGFKWEKDPWGRNWVPVVGTSVEDAREQACKLPNAKPYAMQCKG